MSEKKYYTLEEADKIMEEHIEKNANILRENLKNRKFKTEQYV